MDNRGMSPQERRSALAEQMRILQAEDARLQAEEEAAKQRAAGAPLQQAVLLRSAKERPQGGFLDMEPCAHVYDRAGFCELCSSVDPSRAKELKAPPVVRPCATPTCHGTFTPDMHHCKVCRASTTGAYADQDLCRTLTALANEIDNDAKIKNTNLERAMPRIRRFLVLGEPLAGLLAKYTMQIFPTLPTMSLGSRQLRGTVTVASATRVLIAWLRLWKAHPNLTHRTAASALGGNEGVRFGFDNSVFYPTDNAFDSRCANYMRLALAQRKQDIMSWVKKLVNEVMADSATRSHIRRNTVLARTARLHPRLWARLQELRFLNSTSQTFFVEKKLTALPGKLSQIPLMKDNKLLGGLAGCGALRNPAADTINNDTQRRARNAKQIVQLFAGCFDAEGNFIPTARLPTNQAFAALYGVTIQDGKLLWDETVVVEDDDDDDDDDADDDDESSGDEDEEGDDEEGDDDDDGADDDDENDDGTDDEEIGTLRNGQRRAQRRDREDDEEEEGEEAEEGEAPF